MDQEGARSGWMETAHGKGKLKLRRDQLKSGDPPALPVQRLAAVAHINSENGETDADPVSRFPAAMCDGWLPRMNMRTPQQTYSVWKQMRDGRPTLLAGAPFLRKLLNKWTLEYLKSSGEAADAEGTAKLCCISCSSADKDRFFLGHPSKNVYGTGYHVREPETRTIEMTFADFIECHQKWHASEKVFLQQPLAAFRTEEAGNVSSGKLKPHLLKVNDALGPDIAEDVKQDPEWGWLEDLCEAAGLGRFRHISFQAMARNSLLPLKYSCNDRFVCQVRGRQRMLLVSPDQAMHGLYPFPVHHMYDTYAMIDIERPDDDLWPKCHQVRGVQCILQPGDVIFIPQFWTVAFQGLEDDNISLEISRLDRVLRSEDAAELQISRVVEASVADLEGMENVKHWLGIIARGEELDRIDLSTLQGYRRIQVVQFIRDTIEANLGRGEQTVRDFLLAMCESRLNPTTWLNKDFREPLYLTDKPVWHEDDRTEDERNYPEFFRERLQARGWTVTQAESTLRIPGYNS